MFVRASSGGGKSDSTSTRVLSQSITTGDNSLYLSSYFSKVYACYIHRANYIAIGMLTGSNFSTLKTDANVASSLKITSISGTTVSYYSTTSGTTTIYVVGKAK